MKQRRVVVTGIGTLNPLGNNIEEYFTNLTQGVSGAGPITHFDPSNFKTKFACELKGYDPNNFFDRKEVRKYDLYTQYALIAAEQAIKDSGLDLETIDKDMAGVIWASGIGGLETFYQEVKSYVEGGEIPRYSPFFIPKMIADMGAGQISMKYGFRGPNYCTVSACASSNNAMIDAMTYIRLGRADIIMTGGSEAAINPPGVGGFNSMQALSTRNDDPTRASRPFDADRDGFVIGEGAGAIEDLACILALTKGIVAPTINNENLDPQIDPKLNLTLNKAQQRDVKCALSNTFGFGGHNSTVILKKI